MADTATSAELNSTAAGSGAQEETHRLAHAVEMTPEAARLALQDDELAEYRQKMATLEQTIEAQRATLLLLSQAGPVARLRARVPVVRIGRARLRTPRGSPSQLIARSGLFLSRWYERAYSPLLAGARPFDHFLRHGLAANLQPNPFFDPVWYLQRYPEARISGQPALLHYVRTGAGQILSPGPLFDTVSYADRYADLHREPDPLAHFLKRGMFQGRIASAVRVSYPA